jgi:hypothetical protein
MGAALVECGPFQQLASQSLDGFLKLAGAGTGADFIILCNIFGGN